MRRLLDGGDLLGASDENAALHGRLLEIAGHDDRHAADRDAEVPAGALPVPDDPAARAQRALVRRARGDRRRGRGRATRTPPRRRCARTCRTSPRRCGAPPGERLAKRCARGSCCAGAFDTHVHVAPDVVERKIDDISLARRFAELGMAGFLLKSHYTSTAERASGRARGRARDRGARGDHAQPRGRRDEPARGRDRRARRRADRVAADGRLGQRVPRARGSAGREGAGVGASCSSSCASRASRSSRSRSSTTAARCCPQTRDGAGDDRASRDGAGDRPPRARRDLRRRRRRARGRACATIVITHPEFPSQDLSRRRPACARGARRAARALLHDAAHRQGRVGALDREHPRDRPRALGPLDRSRAGVQPRRWRTGSR